MLSGRKRRMLMRKCLIFKGYFKESCNTVFFSLWFLSQKIWFGTILLFIYDKSFPNRSSRYQVFVRGWVSACRACLLDSAPALKRNEDWASWCSCVLECHWIKHISYLIGRDVLSARNSCYTQVRSFCLEILFHFEKWLRKSKEVCFVTSSIVLCFSELSH